MQSASGVHIACIRDISGRKAYTEALEHRALHDELTGLPNRTLFGDRMDGRSRRADAPTRPRGVLLVDIDEFREVNETLGRENGDELLKAVAERLRGALRDSDTVARLGGDEFGILPSGETDVGGGRGIAWKVREAFEQPFVVGGRRVDDRARASGSRSSRSTVATTADLLRRADLAMHEAKASGSGLAVFVAEPEDQTAAPADAPERAARRHPARRTRAALPAQGRPRGAEDHRGRGAGPLAAPHRGLLMPAQFMPEAERSELIEPLTTWVLDEALRQQRAWLDAGLDLTMAVNISARSLTRGSDLPDTVAALTETWGIAPGHADPRAHRERDDRRRRAGRARAPARDGRAPRDRRLRHRPLVARLPPAAADRRDQGRPLVRHEPRDRRPATR